MQLISMPRGRRRQIEVPTDTQPKFELGDTAEDIERRRREREERERAEQDERERRRIERERREESRERTEKRAQTDMDTDVESTQKEQMKAIFLSDSDKEAIVEFVKQHEEGHFQRQAEKRKTLGDTSIYQEVTCHYNQ